ncbi:MAG: glycosyltransferase family 39 protein, partial [Candidatus Aenigmarchaeota archaeon]|nr:glycosyltransferase family 39 protein [Candidatus Aenigmarchaeota archaeon]
MNKKNKIIVLIFVFALLLRILFIFSMPIKLWDETVYINLGYDLSKNPLEYSFKSDWCDYIPDNSYPKAGFRPPLLPYFISLLYTLKIDILIDFLIPFFGALTTTIVFFIGSEMFNEKAGILSSLFLAVYPLHVLFSSRVMTDVFSTFFIMLAFLFFIKGFEKNNKKYKILFGVVLGLGILSRYTIIWFLPAFGLYFLLKYSSLSFLKDKYFWYSVVSFLLVLTPWFIYGISVYDNPLGAFIHGSKAAYYWGGIQPWYFYLKNWLSIFSFLGIVLVFGIIYLIYKRKIKNKKIIVLLLFVFIYLIFASIAPHKEYRYVIQTVPFVCILSAIFIEHLKKYKKYIIVFSLMFLLIQTAITFYITAKTYYTTNTYCFNQVVKYLKNVNGDFIIVSESSPLFRYYVKKKSFYYPQINLRDFKILENDTNKPIYFVFTRFNS